MTTDLKLKLIGLATTIVLAVCGCLLAASTSFAASFTWSGAAPSGEPKWSAGANWSGTAPSGSVETLTFPSLTSPACSAEPATATCYLSDNDVKGLIVNSLSLDDGFPTEISGEAIHLGAGGLIAAPSGAGSEFAGPRLKLPIVLNASQTWSIKGGKAGRELVLEEPVEGPSTDTLKLSFSQAELMFAIPTVLAVNNSVEAGPITLSGFPGIVLLSPEAHGSLNAVDHKPVTVTEGARIVVAKNAAVGPLTAHEGGVLQIGESGGAAALDVFGGVNFESNSMQFEVKRGTLAGVDYSQVEASETVNVTDAELILFGACRLRVGDVDALITTSGSITGTFHNVPNEGIVTAGASCTTRPTLRIHYGEHTVTATVLSEGSGNELEEETKHEESTSNSGSTSSGGTTSKGGTSGGGGTTAGTPVAVTAIAASLAGELVPTGPAAKIGKLLKSGGFRYAFNALTAGTAAVGWYFLPPGAKLARKAKPVLVASGKLVFLAAGTASLNMKLTAAGKQLLKHAKGIKLTAKSTFTPSNRPAVSSTRTFGIKR